MNRKAVWVLGALWITLWLSQAADRIGRISRALPTIAMSAGDRAAIETGDPELHRAILSGRTVASGADDFERFRTAFERYPTPDHAKFAALLLMIVFAIFLMYGWRFHIEGWGALRRTDRIGLVLVFTGLAAAALEILIPRSAWSNWDAWAVWDFKTKAVLHEGWIPRAFLADPAYRFTHPEYPLLWPWLGAGLSGIAGGWDTRVLRLLPWGCAAALPFLLVALLKESGMVHGRWLVAGVLALLPKVLDHSSNGYVDWPLAAVELAALLMAFRYRRGASPGWAVGLAAGLAANLKMEGLLFGLGLLLALWLTPGRKKKPLVHAAAVLLVLALPWQVFRVSLGITPADFGLPLAEAVHELPGRTLLFLRAVLFEAAGAGPNGRTLGDWWTHLSSSWLLFWFVAGYALLTGWRRLGDPALRIPVVVVGVQVLGAWGAYLLTVQDVQWLLTTSLDRLMLQWVPGATLISCVLLARHARVGKWGVRV